MTRICHGCAARDMTVLVQVDDVLYCRVCLRNNQPAVTKPEPVKEAKPRKAKPAGGGWHT